MLRAPLAFIVFTVLYMLAVRPAEAATYTIDGDVAGEVTRYTVKDKDTLYSVARHFDLGIVEIMAANPGLDPWIPPVGTELTLPTAYVLPTISRKGIVIDLSALRLFYFPDPKTVMTFPLGIGMDGWSTPTGTTRIVLKRDHPTWIAPESILKENPDLPKVVPPGPDNPLGDYALNLGWEGYRIHGTNKPYGIGRRSSHGCMRMYPEDIETLFKAVTIGTPVTVIETPYKIGWKGNTLYLQTTPSQAQADEIATRKTLSLADIPQMYGDLRALAGEGADIDWDAVHNAAMWRTTVPIEIATRDGAAVLKPETVTEQESIPEKTTKEETGQKVVPAAEIPQEEAAEEEETDEDTQ